MKNTIKLTLLSAAVVFTTYACKEKKVAATKAAPVKVIGQLACDGTQTYISSVKALLDKSCASSCHGAQHPAAGIDLTTYESVKLEASKPRFMGALRHEEAYAAMPRKSPKFSDSTLNVIACWIEGGMQP